MLSAFQHRRETVKSNAKCWTPTAAVPLIVMLWLTGCATGGFEGQSLCPLVVEYTAADQALAADEVDAPTEGATVIRMLSDYAVLREQAQACG